MNSICVVDFNGTMKFRGYSEPTSFWADYYPDKKIVIFGGAWGDVPNMPVKEQPTEEQINKWVKDHISFCAAEKRWAAMNARNEKSDKQFEQIDQAYKLNGYNWLTVNFSLPNGEIKTISQCCGLRTRWEMLPIVSKYLQRDLPKGSKIKRFKFEQKLSKKEVEKRRSFK